VPSVYDPLVLGCGKPVNKVEDLKGLLIRTWADPFATIVSATGATPSFVPISEDYTMLQRKTMDGMITPLETYGRYKIYEVTEYFIDLNLPAKNCAYSLVNMDIWNNLSPAEQAIVDEVSEEQVDLVTKMIADYQSVTYENAKAVQTYSIFPPEELDKWSNLPEVKAWAVKWVKDMEAKGEPALEALNGAEKILGLPLTKVE
jgi:TRAP-type C4-dicarboxylate transport system substrate-binding protein